MEKEKACGLNIEIGDNIVIDADILEHSIIILSSKMKMFAPKTAKERKKMEVSSCFMKENKDGSVTLFNTISIGAKVLKVIADALKKGEDGEYYFEYEEK